MKENQITFENLVQDGRYWVQSIMYNNKEIGALVQRNANIFTEIEEKYQRRVKDTPENRMYDWYHSEDEGFIFIKFPTLTEFLASFNHNKGE